MIHFVIGGARSGKSRYAQQLVADASGANDLPVHYIATATPVDDEMAMRIHRHQSDRPADWLTTEAPLALTDAIKRLPTQDIVLIDCLTLWLNNQLFNAPKQDFSVLFDALCQTCAKRSGTTVIVANEVGLGIIPMGETSRQFVDLAGWLNQAMAETADRVTFTAAGLPLHLKGTHDE